MNNYQNQFRYSALIILAAALISVSIIGQEKPAAKAEEEMKSAFGTVPLMLEAYPENMRSGAWEWFKATQNPEGAIPPKYKELISLGVASQIPCSYCIYAHTTRAKFLGATEEEIREAIVSSAETRHWSTILNGSDISLEEFKKEWDGILEHVRSQSHNK